MSKQPSRPKLTLPEAEAECLRDAYARASVILEYGSGGSTVMGSEMEAKTITSVECDKAWHTMMQNWFDANPPAKKSSVNLVWSDIGPTRSWAFPVNNAKYANYPDYPLGVWEEGMMEQPDTVLIDGRFRVGCALGTAFNTKKAVDLYIDDYIDRHVYQAVELWFGSPTMIGRMAHFNVSPTPIVPSELGQVMQLMLRQG